MNMYVSFMEDNKIDVFVDNDDDKAIEYGKWRAANVFYKKLLSIRPQENLKKILYLNEE